MKDMQKKISKRHIAVLTGKRGGFGALITLMQAIDRDPDLRLSLIVTDMHLSPQFGETVQEVEQWFRVAARIDLKQEGDSGPARAMALGRCVTEMTKTLESLRPDLLVLLGDRGEVLSAAIAAMEQNIPIAHILGGDVAGNRDGSRIHAITKLANLHFPSSKDSYARILRLGEERWRVHNFGATYIDLIVAGLYTPNTEARSRYHVAPDEPYVLCIQHPVTLTESRSYDEAKEVFAALDRLGMRVLVSYPCSDQGYAGVLRAIDEVSQNPKFSIHKNIPAVDYWSLMSGAALFVGNSSSGLMETPYFRLPSVNVGRRQDGRIRDVNVIDSKPEARALNRAIQRALDPAFRRSLRNHFVFGKGNAGARIAEVLKKIPLDDKLLIKRITF